MDPLADALMIHHPDRLTGRPNVIPLPVEKVTKSAREVIKSCGFVEPRMATIVRAVCEFYSVSHIALVSKRRRARLCFCRQVAMYLCRELTTHSFPEIGRIFGDRDHTTVMHGCDKIETMIEVSERTADEIEVLKLRIIEMVMA